MKPIKRERLLDIAIETFKFLGMVCLFILMLLGFGYLMLEKYLNG